MSSTDIYSLPTDVSIANTDGTKQTFSIPCTDPYFATYTMYVIPRTNQIEFYIGPSSAATSTDYSIYLDNFKVENVTNPINVLYTSVMNNLTDYYAFGSPMPGRKYVGSNYAYNFNGKRSDAEANSTAGGIQDYGFRIYNPSLGRFLSIDPLTNDYPELTPYQFAGNTPILAIDIDGLEPGLRRTSRRAILTRSKAKEIIRQVESKPISLNFGMRPTNDKGTKIRFTPSTTLADPEKEPRELNKTAEITRLIIDEALGQLEQYKKLTTIEEIESSGFTEENGSYFFARTIVSTKVMFQIPISIKKLEIAYQKRLKMQANGNLTDKEFSKLPIEEQMNRISGAKITMGSSPLYLFISKVKEKIKEEESKPTYGGTSKETLVAAPTY